MDEYGERPRKRLDERAGGDGAAGDGAIAGRGRIFRSGQRKDGRRMSVVLRERTGRAKPGVEASLALYGEESRRKDWGPQVAPRREPAPQERSVRLRLEVQGGRISVLDSTVVDVPPADRSAARGTAFIEVRAGKSVVALEPLVDPGLSIGIPDRSDPADAFRGHRVIEDDTWEAVVRVPVEAVADREAELSVSIYRASERLILEAESDLPLARRSRRVEEVATSAPIRAAELPHLEVERDERKPGAGSSAE
ncbi:MAG TPA: hypothetical protein VGE78_03815 [Agromyces sp.]